MIGMTTTSIVKPIGKNQIPINRVFSLIRTPIIGVYVYDDLYINDKVNLIGQTIPLLFNQPSADSEQMLDGNPLPEVVKAINYVVSDEVFDIFVAETKIELTEENKSDIYDFFVAKGNWQSDEYRKQGLATLIEALRKSYNAL